MVNYNLDIAVLVLKVEFLPKETLAVYMHSAYHQVNSASVQRELLEPCVSD